MQEKNDKLILISNDDGVNAPGLKVLIEMLQPYGKVLVVAPEEGQSGMSHALTSKLPLRLRKVKDEPNLQVYACSGTPVDCIKIAMSKLVDRKPDLLAAGVNHGSNASINIVYSGTMGAANEGIMYHMPAIGFSLNNHSLNANFSALVPWGRKIVDNVFENGLQDGVALNVNFPDLTADEIKGIRLCRQNKGIWMEDFELRTDPAGHDYYWLKGYYINEEPEAKDTDEAAMAAGYVAVVPVQLDLTAYNELNRLKSVW